MDYFQQKKQRIPNDQIYDIFLTLLIAILIIWAIYIFTPYQHYNLYVIEPKNK